MLNQWILHLQPVWRQVLTTETLHLTPALWAPPWPAWLSWRPKTWRLERPMESRRGCPTAVDFEEFQRDFPCSAFGWMCCTCREFCLGIKRKGGKMWPSPGNGLKPRTLLLFAAWWKKWSDLTTSKISKRCDWIYWQQQNKCITSHIGQGSKEKPSIQQHPRAMMWWCFVCVSFVHTWDEGPKSKVIAPKKINNKIRGGASTIGVSHECRSTS